MTLHILSEGLAEQAVLGERDPLVASFWKVLFSEPDWLIDQLGNIEVTLAEWDRYRSTAGELVTDRERALACLFLNRTSFSGILAANAGPIGGRRQTSEYKIDCRFNVAMLTRRIRESAKLAEKVVLVSPTPATETIDRVEEMAFCRGEVFYYLDPPFYHKASDLYRYFFEGGDHKALHDRLMEIEQHWLLSYDPAQPVLEMYSHNGHGPARIDSLYSVANGKSLVQAQELIITNVAALPKATRLWRSNQEWETPRNAHQAASDN